MKTLKITMLLSLLISFICLSVQAETYFCSSADYTGDFNPEMKGETESCENLKEFDLPYSICLQSAVLYSDAYKLGEKAFNNGNCVPYQTRTMKVGSASCSARFIAKENYASLSIETQFGKSEDRQACYNKLESTLREEFPDLNQLKR